MRKITIYDIAKASGYSVSTVSKAMSGTGKINEETRRYIEEKAREIGYNALGNVTSDKKRVAVIYPNRPKELSEMLWKSVLEIKERYVDYNLEFIDCQYEYSAFEDGGDRLVKSLFEYDAVVYYGTALNEQTVNKLNELAKEIPVATVAVISAYIENAMRITTDPFEIGSLAAELFWLMEGKGCCAGIIAGLSSHEIHNENIRGFYEIANRRGFAVKEVYCTDDGYEMIYESTRLMVERHPDLNSLFVTTSLVSAACKAISDFKRNGIKVIAVDCTDENIELLEKGEVKTLISQNQQKQIKTAVDAAVRKCLRLRGASKEYKDFIIRPEIVIATNLKYYKKKRSL